MKTVLNGHMLEGRCPKCNTRYSGWALAVASQQACSECGHKLNIYESETGRLISTGYSIFEADNYIVEASSSEEKLPEGSEQTLKSSEMDEP